MRKIKLPTVFILDSDDYEIKKFDINTWDPFYYAEYFPIYSTKHIVKKIKEVTGEVEEAKKILVKEYNVPDIIVTVCLIVTAVSTLIGVPCILHYVFGWPW